MAVWEMSTASNTISMNPYFIVRRARRLSRFLSSAFDAEEIHCDTTTEGTVRHVELRIGGSTIELSEAREGFPARTGAVHLFVRDTDLYYRRAMQAGAESLYEPADMPYGRREAGIIDPAGNLWFIGSSSNE